MRALAKVAQMGLLRQMTYRTNYAVSYLLKATQLLIALVVWRAIFQSAESVQGLTWDDMASYLVLVTSISLFLYPQHMFDLQPLVQRGTLSVYLLRPLRYPLYTLAAELGARVPKAIATLAFGITMIALLGARVAIAFDWRTLSIVTLCTGLSFVLGMLVASLAFWIIEMWPLKRIFQGCMLLLGGMAAPLELYPSVLRRIAECTPFPYLAYVPIYALTGRLSPGQLTSALWSGALWITALSIAYLSLWRLGLKRYEAVNC